MLTTALLSISSVSSVTCAGVAATSVHTRGLFMAVIYTCCTLINIWREKNCGRCVTIVIIYFAICCICTPSSIALALCGTMMCEGSKQRMQCLSSVPTPNIILYSHS